MTADSVRDAAVRAKGAAVLLAPSTRGAKDAALLAIADALLARTDEVLAANRLDVADARAAGTSAALVDRLTLTPARITAMADGLRQVAGLPDPVGEIVRGSTLPNGLELKQVRVPFGVVGIVYEARPNVTVDAAGLCLKSGNAALLRGSGSAYRSNTALVDVLRSALVGAGLPADAVVLVPGTDHSSVKEMLRLRGLIDVLIPRGGAALIQTVVTESTVPVIETGVGTCHVYVDADADPDMAVAITLDAKTTKPSVCNAAETLLVHRDAAPAILPRMLVALREAGVTVHGDATVLAYAAGAPGAGVVVDGVGAGGLAAGGVAAGGPVEAAAADAAHDLGTESSGPGVVPATDEDWAAEYLSLDLAVAVVDSLPDALAHIRRWGTGHTEAIVTQSLPAARAFVAGCDSAAVMINASTRFTDGERLGMGAEIGISTQKLHARGPMGLPELTSTTWVATGDGHLVG